MLRALFLIAAAVAIAAVFAPGFRETLAWVLAFVSAILLGDLLRGVVGKLRRRGEPSPARRG